MSKELIRLVNCTMAYDNETVLNSINLCVKDKEFSHCWAPADA